MVIRIFTDEEKERICQAFSSGADRIVLYDTLGQCASIYSPEGEIDFSSCHYTPFEVEVAIAIFKEGSLIFSRELFNSYGQEV